MVIIGGAADEPIPDLDDRTPLEAAATPGLDALAQSGRVGRVGLIPKTATPAPHTARAALFGHEVTGSEPGRAALLAAARGVDARGGTLLAVDLLSVTGEPGDLGRDGRVVSVGAEAMSEAEATALVQDFAAELGDRFPGFELHAPIDGVAIAVDRAATAYGRTETVAASELIDYAWAPSLPDGGEGGERLGAFVGLSHAFLTDHPINRARVEQTLPPVNMLWPSGPCIQAKLDALDSRFGRSTLVISDDEATRGLAIASGLRARPAPPASELTASAVAAFEDHEVVVVTVEAPDRASRRADWRGKIESIERIDAGVITPLSRALSETFGDEGWRSIVVVDHATPCETRQTDSVPTPFLMSGAFVRSVVRRPFTEAAAAESDLRVEVGHELMEFFLRSGLRGR